MHSPPRSLPPVPPAEEDVKLVQLVQVGASCRLCSRAWNARRRWRRPCMPLLPAAVLHALRTDGREPDPPPHPLSAAADVWPAELEPHSQGVWWGRGVQLAAGYSDVWAWGSVAATTTAWLRSLLITQPVGAPPRAEPGERAQWQELPAALVQPAGPLAQEGALLAGGGEGGMLGLLCMHVCEGGTLRQRCKPTDTRGAGPLLVSGAG